MAIHDANLAKLPKKAKFFLVGATTSATNGFAERANEPIEAVRVVMAGLDFKVTCLIVRLVMRQWQTFRLTLSTIQRKKRAWTPMILFPFRFNLRFSIQSIQTSFLKTAHAPPLFHSSNPIF